MASKWVERALQRNYEARAYLFLPGSETRAMDALRKEAEVLREIGAGLDAVAPEVPPYKDLSGTIRMLREANETARDAFRIVGSLRQVPERSGRLEEEILAMEERSRRDPFDPL